jgi:hypothetical protein
MRRLFSRDKIANVNRRRLTAILASFLVFYTLADLSRTGLCDDSEYATRVSVGHTMSSLDAHRSPSGEGCFCCSMILTPHRIFQIEGLEPQKDPIPFPGVRAVVMCHPSLYHPPKVA